MGLLWQWYDIRGLGYNISPFEGAPTFFGPKHSSSELRFLTAERVAVCTTVRVTRLRLQREEKMMNMDGSGIGH